jgi:hypothetical protein
VTRQRRRQGLPERLIDTDDPTLLGPLKFVVGVLSATVRDWWRGKQSSR